MSSFKVQQGWAKVINNASDLQVWEGNDTTPYAAFNGWTADNYCHITPLADPFLATQLRSFSKTVVKADNLPVATGDFATTATVGIGLNPNTKVSTTIVSRERAQIRTFTVTGVPAVGSRCRVILRYRELSRDLSCFLQGDGVHYIDIDIRTGDTTTTIAQRIRAKLIELSSSTRGANYYLKGLTVTGAADTLTITFGKAGIEFDLIVEGEAEGWTNLPATVAIGLLGGFPAVPFKGVNNFGWMRKYAQTNRGLYNLNDGSTNFLPIDGVYYTSYFITYRHESVWESQPDTINAVQQHDVTIKLWVNPALTGLIAQLDAIGV